MNAWLALAAVVTTSPILAGSAAPLDQFGGGEIQSAPKELPPVGQPMPAMISPAYAQPEKDPDRRYVFASHQAGAWQGSALYFSDHADGPEYQCRLSSSDATLIQLRASESKRLEGRWILLEDLRKSQEGFQIRWVRIGKRLFEVATLPWRLPQPGPDGINLSFDVSFIAIRRDPSSQWLPFEYLTLDMLEARSFELGFEYKTDSERFVRGKRTISLSGFREVAKWCGRQLLRDRKDQRRVRELIE